MPGITNINGVRRPMPQTNRLSGLRGMVDQRIGAIAANRQRRQAALRGMKLGIRRQGGSNAR